MKSSVWKEETRRPDLHRILKRLYVAGSAVPSPPGIGAMEAIPGLQGDSRWRQHQLGVLYDFSNGLCCRGGEVLQKLFFFFHRCKISHFVHRVHIADTRRRSTGKQKLRFVLSNV